MFGAFALAAAWVGFAVYSKVDDYHPMPSSVPAGAVEIPLIAKSRGWVACSIEAAETRCRVFNQWARRLPMMSSCRLTAEPLPTQRT